MHVPKWNESDFAMTVLSGLDLLDPTGRLRKPELVGRIIPVITSNHVVNERSEALVASNGFGKSECPMLFLDVPAKHWLPVEDGGDQEAIEGMDALSEVVWTETSTSGAVQQGLPGRFILCRTKVKRNLNNPTTGASPYSVQVTFVTEDAGVANVFYTTPVAGSLVRKAESITKQLDLLVERMPENVDTVATLLSPAVQEAVNRLSQITERAGLQLTLSSDGKLALAPGSAKKAS